MKKLRFPTLKSRKVQREIYKEEYEKEYRKAKLKEIQAKARRKAREDVRGGTVQRSLKKLGKQALKELTKPPKKRKGKSEDPFGFW